MSKRVATRQMNMDVLITTRIAAWIISRKKSQ